MTIEVYINTDDQAHINRLLPKISKILRFLSFVPTVGHTIIVDELPFSQEYKATVYEIVRNEKGIFVMIK
jgi:hypothetical protein